MLAPAQYHAVAGAGTPGLLSSSSEPAGVVRSVRRAAAMRPLALILAPTI
jgi:hypothetical protein